MVQSNSWTTTLSLTGPVSEEVVFSCEAYPFAVLHFSSTGGSSQPITLTFYGRQVDSGDDIPLEVSASGASGVTGNQVTAIAGGADVKVWVHDPAFNFLVINITASLGTDVVTAVINGMNVATPIINTEHVDKVVLTDTSGTAINQPINVTELAVNYDIITDGSTVAAGADYTQSTPLDMAHYAFYDYFLIADQDGTLEIEVSTDSSFSTSWVVNTVSTTAGAIAEVLQGHHAVRYVRAKWTNNGTSNATLWLFARQVP